MVDELAQKRIPRRLLVLHSCCRRRTGSRRSPAGNRRWHSTRRRTRSVRTSPSARVPRPETAPYWPMARSALHALVAETVARQRLACRSGGRILTEPRAPLSAPTGATLSSTCSSLWLRSGCVAELNSGRRARIKRSRWWSDWETVWLRVCDPVSAVAAQASRSTVSSRKTAAVTCALLQIFARKPREVTSNSTTSIMQVLLPGNNFATLMKTKLNASLQGARGDAAILGGEDSGGDEIALLRSMTAKPVSSPVGREHRRG